MQCSPIRGASAQRWLGVVVTALAVCLAAACGGGSGSGAPAGNPIGSTTSNPASTTGTTASTGSSGSTGTSSTGASGTSAPGDAAAARIAAALQAGDSNLLKAEDAAAVIAAANASFQQTARTQKALLDAFYVNDSTRFELIRESYMVQPPPTMLDQTFPLVVGDKGNVLASVSTVGGGRIAGYGYDILSGFDKSNTVQGTSRSNQDAHRPVFKRVLAWLVANDAARDLTAQLPSSLAIAWGSLPTASQAAYFDGTSAIKIRKPYAVAGMEALGVKFNNLNCDPLSAPIADCAAKAQLVVIGAIDRRAGVDLATQLARIRAIVQAKIPLLYLNAHPDGGAANDYARAAFADDYPRLTALGFAAGDEPDRRNYYALDQVAEGLSLAALKARTSVYADVVARISNNNFTSYNWADCPNQDKCSKPAAFVAELEAPMDLLRNTINGLNTAGINIFDNAANSKSLPLWVLWADTYRKNIVYPIDKSANQADFQRAYLADSLVAYVRPAGSAQTDLGNFLGKEVSSVTGSADFETLTVTLPGSDGYTAIGRFALPGQPVTVQLLSPAPAGVFNYFFNTAIEGTTKYLNAAVDSNGNQLPGTGYRRPLYLNSPDFLLSAQSSTVVSPYGGPILLRFSGAQDASISVRIKGAARHPFYDTTQGTPDAAAFFSDVKSTKLGWLEIKTPGMEIHSLASMAFSFLSPKPGDTATTAYPNPKSAYYSNQGGINMAKYLDEAKHFVMDDAYQLAGFQSRGLLLPTGVSTFCADKGWDCTNASLHKPPTALHYHIDFAAVCGSMCSTNPITSNAAFDPRGWGESHELGHRLQALYVYGGMSSEVSNNIFPLHKRWRLLRELGRDAIGYENGLGETQTVFDMLKAASKLAPADQVATIKAQLWTDASYAAQNRARLYFYVQWVLIYYEALKAKNSTWTDAQLWSQAWDIFPLLYLQQRQIAGLTAANWDANEVKFGFAANEPYLATRLSDTLSYHDYLLTALSFITGRNQSTLFNMWGIQTSATAQAQVASKNYSLQPAKFYAVVCSDDFRSYQAVDMTAAQPALPWVGAFSSASANLAACNAATARLPAP